MDIPIRRRLTPLLQSGRRFAGLTIMVQWSFGRMVGSTQSPPYGIGSYVLRPRRPTLLCCRLSQAYRSFGGPLRPKDPKARE